MIDFSRSLVLQAAQPVGAWAYPAHVAVGIFAVVLFVIALYAWSRRRQLGLLLVTTAFLLFGLKELIWILSQTYSLNLSTDIIRTLLDLVVLSLFFVAIMLRPRPQLS